MTTTPGLIECPLCGGTGLEDEWYEECYDSDDWQLYQEICRRCMGRGHFTSEEATILKLKGQW